MTYYFHSEALLQHYPDVEYEAYIAEHLESGYWRQPSGVQTYYCYLPALQSRAYASNDEHSSKCIVVFPGRAEAAVKYHELMYELCKNGYSVFVIDHQGQGFSSRLLANPHIGYVADFDDYVQDAKRCIDNVLLPLLGNESLAQHTTKTELLLLCHSMGGAIGTLFVRQFPEVFTKVALSAPMFGVKMPLPEKLVQYIVRITISVIQLFGNKADIQADNTNLQHAHSPKVGGAVRYMWGQGDYQPYPFITNRLTYSEARYAVFRQVMSTHPKAQLGGISFQWLYRAICAMQLIRRDAQAIEANILVLKAADDEIVDNKKLSETAMCLANSQLVTIANAQHEILFEKDHARREALRHIYDFFTKR